MSSAYRALRYCEETDLFNINDCDDHLKGIKGGYLYAQVLKKISDLL